MLFIKKIISFFSILCVFAFLVSCGGIKPGGGKTGKNLHETFYVGEEGIQYFIKPLAFRNQETDLLLDITFRHKDKVQDSATINFSIQSNELIKQIDTLTLSTTEVFSSIASNKIEYMFAERTKKGYISRFSTKIELITIEKLFKNSDWKLNVISKETAKKEYLPTSSTKKNIEKLNQNIFVLF